MQEARKSGALVPMKLGTKDAYLVNDPGLIRQILVTDADKFVKGTIILRTRPYVGDGIISSEGEKHKRNRRLMQPMFNRLSVERYIPKFVEAVAEITSGWSDGATIEADKELTRLATHSLTKAMFSDPGGARELAVVTEEVIDRFIAGIGVRIFLPDLITRLPTPGNKKFEEGRRALRDETWSLIQRRRESGGYYDDIISTMLRDQHPDGTSMTDDEIVDEVVTLMLAGVETVSSVVTAAFSEIDRNPDMAERLHQEVDAVLNGAPVTAENIDDLPFLAAFVTEILRVYAPTWILMRNAVEPVDLGETRINPGNEIIFSPTAVHRDPAFYPDPIRINPDRWLPGEVVQPRDGTWAPFGQGKRKCIGDTFAWYESRVWIASIASRWTLHSTGKPMEMSAAGTYRATKASMITKKRSKARKGKSSPQH
ncbi:cytochrome P450 [Saccharopolyspora terrae]|nr:cytochrome P450 [Saccharopolyspora terrae]